MRRLPWRAALYLAVLGYLFFDFKVCHGPLRDAMRSRRDAGVVEARARGWVALVNQEPITKEQVDLATARHLFQRGKQPGDLPERNLAMIRRAVLQSLIDETLVRQHADGQGFEAPAGERAAFASAWKSGFASEGDLAAGMSAEGFSAEGLDAELGRIWSRKRWLEQHIEPGVAVTEEESLAWFEANRSGEEGKLRPGFFEPAKRRLREIRFASEAEAQARSRVGLGDGAGFVDLGWVARGDLPESLDAAVFAAAEPGLLPPTGSPLGWHLIEVVEMAAERPLTYDEIRGEIRSLLEANRAEATVKLLMGKLRKVANLQIFPENL